MRIYQKINENDEKVLYEYLWGSYKKPFTGLIEINKKNNSASVLKTADDDNRPEYAGAYALYTLSKNKYPKRYTHTAP
jgi:hypothetical protein